MNLNSYQDIFNARGNSYDEAMKLLPQARATEFEKLFNSYTPSNQAVVVDIPSGGGYLKQYLPNTVNFKPLETSEVFASYSNIMLCTWDKLPIENSEADMVTCCAALHHVEENMRSLFFEETLRVLKTGGAFVCCDVERGSEQDEFLNVFVDKYNPIGHKGNFISESLIDDLLDNFNVVSNKLEKYTWKLGKEEETGLRYLQLMFGISEATLSQIKTEAERLLSFRFEEEYLINWQLRYVTCLKK
ncbi:MAG: methyltransferase domain-containing protein [Reichenbachiella sp.]|uniref:methyltransferase domain-containing protein n=1 Tax=Reichenbachiella sp. TaxID=2184521 RepID=UPI003297FC34